MISNVSDHSGYAGVPTRRRYLAIAAISLGTTLTVIDGSIATVALPTIAQDLHIRGASAVLVVTIYQLVLVMALLPFSALGARVGLKRLYQYGQLLFTIATILCFFANSLPFLLVVRALQALGGAASLSVMSALIRYVYPQAKLGRGLGVNTVFVSISSAIAPTAGGLILGVASWQWLFVAGAPFAVLSLWLGFRGLPDVPAVVGRYDLAGALLNVATMGLIIAGLEVWVQANATAVSSALVLAGIGFAAAFVLHERRQQTPILPVDLLARPIIALSVAGSLLAFTGSVILLLSIPFRLQHGYGISPGEIGAMIAPWPLTTLIVAPVAGVLSDRYPAGLLGGIGMAIATLALILFAWLPKDPSYYDIAWRMALCGAGSGLYLTPNLRLILGSVPPLRAAAAGGLTATARLTGQMLGATLVAKLLALGYGSSFIPALVAAALSGVAGILSLARLSPAFRNRGPRESQAVGG